MPVNNGMDHHPDLNLKTKPEPKHSSTTPMEAWRPNREPSQHGASAGARPTTFGRGIPFLSRCDVQRVRYSQSFSPWGLSPEVHSPYFLLPIGAESAIGPALAPAVVQTSNSFWQVQYEAAVSRFGTR